MKINILGAGPAGLYCGLLLKKAAGAHEITVVERNPPDATYGWGVVFSDRTLAAFQEADYTSYRAISDRFVSWEAIDTYYHGELVRCGGHAFAGLARQALLGILQARCRELGVTLHFHSEVSDLATLEACDLLVAADGVNSLVRRAYEDTFRPQLTPGMARYIWFGTDKVLDAFTFIFRENEHGFFQVHAYPFSGTMSTFIVECDDQTWHHAGLDHATAAESIAYCERLFAPELGGSHLYPNRSSWISFLTVKCATWRRGNVVLLGDSAHTAHFSIGSGTKLAMEDAIALANTVEQHPDLETALAEYELLRRPVVETLQAAAAESQAYFEGVRRYARLEPVEFAFNLLTRSRRISYDDLRLRDQRFGELVDRWYERHYWAHEHKRVYSLIAPAPMLTPLTLREMRLPNRVVFSPQTMRRAMDEEPARNPATATDSAAEGLPTLAYALEAVRLAQDGAGLVLTEPVAVSAEGRVTPEDNGLYGEEQVPAWRRIVRTVHHETSARFGIVLGHAGRRGATRPRGAGLDRPLRKGSWPLIAPSALPYTARGQPPRALDRGGMDAVRDAFARAAGLAAAAGCDLLALHAGHGYLLASFLSPLANRRDDDYGGSLGNRLRFPLEVFDAVRAVWPAKQPLAVALTVDDCVPGGLTYAEAVAISRAFAAHGCDLVMPLAGQSIPDAAPVYRRGFLSTYAERLRNDTGVRVLAGGYLTTTNEVNTLLAGGRADLCLMVPPRAPERATPERPTASPSVAEAPDGARRRDAPMADAGSGAPSHRRTAAARRARTRAAAPAEMAPAPLEET